MISIDCKELLLDILNDKGSILIIGETDTGKSTLARCLAEGILKGNYKLGFVDSDIGQSALGLPGTVCSGIFSKEQTLKPQRMTFIGTLNPAKRIPLMIETVGRHVRIAEKSGAEFIVIDTTGLVRGWAGRALKLGKIKTIRPVHIVALERDDELGHILYGLKDMRVHRLSPSPHARVRSRAERIRYRMKKFEDYFKGSGEFEIPPEVPIFDNKNPVGKMDICLQEGTVLGLNTGFFSTAGLGIFQRLSRNRLVIKTPLPSIKRVKRIVLSDIVLGAF